MENCKQIFLHGLESSSLGYKGKYFSQKFKEMMVPDFTGSLAKRMRKLENLAENVKDLVLVGSSFGGLMATQYTQANPLKVRKLILLAPALNFAEFSPPVTKLKVPAKLIIGSQDSVTPPKVVIPLAQSTFENIEIFICEDDHSLRKTFDSLDWQELLK